jgi:hypothetical protein
MRESFAYYSTEASSLLTRSPLSQTLRAGTKHPSSVLVARAPMSTSSREVSRNHRDGSAMSHSDIRFVYTFPSLPLSHSILNLSQAASQATPKPNGHHEFLPSVQSF